MRPSAQRAPAREAMRSTNQLAVFHAIHRHGPISRVELAALLRLSPASITDITSEMIERRLVYEAREAESTGVGRRKVLLEVDYGHAAVVGIKVSNVAVHAALTDLKSDVLSARVDALASTDVETVVGAVVGAVEALRAETADNLVGIGVSVPGSVDHAAGTVAYSPLLGWRDAHLAEALEDATGLPVVVENDVNALATAEAWFGRGREAEDFLVVTLGRGVGLGIVLNGELYRGPRGGAGELGHVVLEPGGLDGMYAGRGTVEAYLSDDGLLRQALASVPGLPPGAGVDALLALAEAGDREARALFDRAGTVLGRTLSMLVNLFAPSLVVLAGEGMRAASYLLPPARRILAAYGFGDAGERTEIAIEPWGDDAWARGAATLAASYYLEREASRTGGERPGETSN